MISLIISLVVVSLIVYIAFWALGEIGLPAPFDKIIRVIIVVIAFLYLLNILLPFAGVSIK